MKKVFLGLFLVIALAGCKKPAMHEPHSYGFTPPTIEDNSLSNPEPQDCYHYDENLQKFVWGPCP